MSWKYEIFRCFFLAFGMFEVISNLTYLIKNNGLDLAIKQHGELPKGISKNKIKLKVCCMFIYGVLFFIVGLISFINKSVNSTMYIVILILFSIYSICEAMYYRYWKTISFASLCLMLTASFIF